MFSYLRPRSRHGTFNAPEETAKNPAKALDFQSGFPPQPQAPPPPIPPMNLSTNTEDYSPIISTRAPTLPQIPRVASAYGTVPSLAPNEPQPWARPVSVHSRGHSIEEEKSTDQTNTSPRSVANTSMRPKGNFSRPFHMSSGPNGLVEERGNVGLQEIWKAAAQTAQSNPYEPQQGRGRRFQTPVTGNTTAVRQVDWSPESSKPNTTRVPRMPFQDDEQRSPVSKPALSVNVPAFVGPHTRQISEGSIPQSQREPGPYSRVLHTRPSESQLSLPNLRTKEQAPLQEQSQSMASANAGSSHRTSRLTRLNPMAFLSRRRSSQPSYQAENDTYRRNVMQASNLPQDYVGIRGTRVHDFSAPRSHRVVSQQTMSSAHSDRSPDGTSDLLHVRTKSRDESLLSHGGPSPSPDRKSESPRVHTPVFRENFDDDGRNVWRYDQEDPRNKNTLDILDRASSSDEYYSDSSSDAPPFAPALRDPLLLGDPTFGLFSADSSLPTPPQEFSFIVPKHLAGPSPQPKTPRSRPHTPVVQDRSPRNSKPKASPKDPRAPRSASTPPPSTTPPGSPFRETLRTPSPQSHDLPRHSKSNASRFSFDLAGFGSSHHEKLLEDRHRQKVTKDLQASKISQITVPEIDAGLDSDENDDGADFDEDLEEEFPGNSVDEDDFPMAKSIADSTLDSTHGFTGSQTLPHQLYTHQNVDVGVSSIQPTPTPSIHIKTAKQASALPTSISKMHVDDDFYFDDGIIEDADLQITGEFDESVFDDDSHQIGRHLQAPLSAVPEHQSQESSRASTRPMSQESNVAAAHGLQESTDTSRTSLPPAQTWDKAVVGKRGSTLKNDVTVAQDIQADLTQGNLAAYHDALALATQQAATEGRFERNSVAESALVGKDLPNTIPYHKEDRPGFESNGLDEYEDADDRVTFDDYEQEDDDVIAAANADALDYDADFYGQEFHFYKGNGAEHSQLGGVFINDIKRSHSGRVNGQEPSLTPITEKSEWSTRNSMVSLALGPNTFNSAVQQPGLAQIADSLRGEEDDMSVSTLMRLRQNAFAGSASSLHSGGSGKSGSPPGSSSQNVSQLRTGGGHSRSQSDRSHPLRMQTEQDETSPKVLQPTLDLLPGGRRSLVKGHSRNSSGAESVTYVQENDGEGSRWVLERHRTAEDGSIEILDRQVVQGGRI